MGVLVRVFTVVVFINLMVAMGQSLLWNQKTQDELVRSAPVEAVNAVLNAAPQQESSVILITDTKSQLSSASEVVARWGLGLFEVAVDNQNDSTTQAQFSQVVGKALQIRQVSMPLTIVIVSDDPVFLTAFVNTAINIRLTVWLTRVLILTRLLINQIQPIRKFLSTTNSMLLLLSHTQEISCHVYIAQPYSTDDSQLLHVAVWTHHRGLAISQTSHLFPQKYERFANKPQLKISYVDFPSTRRIIVDDPDVPGGKRVKYLDPEVTLFENIAKIMNFTYQIISPGRTAFGVEQPNGSWTGLVGMLQREEVDISQSVLHINLPRSRVVDYTFPVTYLYAKTIVRRGSPEVDPWGFLFPLAPLVWLAILGSLVVVINVVILLHSCLPYQMPTQSTLSSKVACSIRTLLQQDVNLPELYWGWERVLMGVWMLVIVVLTRSYAGNLMSILAVRYIPMPIQTLQDIIDQSATVVVPGGTTLERTFRYAPGGMLKKIGDLHEKDLFKPIPVSGFVSYLNNVVRQRGDHVLISTSRRTTVIIAGDFTKTGRCDFYQAMEIFPVTVAYAGPKNSPLLNSVSLRVMRANEAGLYNYWMQLYTPNFTTCLNPPKKVVVRTTLGISNIWGTLVILAGGIIASLIVFCLEIIYSYLPF